MSLHGARAAARAAYLRRPPERSFFDRVCAHRKAMITLYADSPEHPLAAPQLSVPEG